MIQFIPSNNPYQLKLPLTRFNNMICGHGGGFDFVNRRSYHRVQLIWSTTWLIMGQAPTKSIISCLSPQSIYLNNWKITDWPSLFKVGTCNLNRLSDLLTFFFVCLHDCVFVTFFSVWAHCCVLLVFMSIQLYATFCPAEYESILASTCRGYHSKGSG
jgi:hypothetical protein